MVSYDKFNQEGGNGINNERKAVTNVSKFRGETIKGAGDPTRTGDLRITNALLYLLSYAGHFRSQDSICKSQD